MIKMSILAIAAVLATSAANAECIVADPSPTPLNVRTAPYGRIIGTLVDGQIVSIIDRSTDRSGTPWVYVADANGVPLGWIYRPYIDCEHETRY
jgi:hypothetical protein